MADKIDICKDIDPKDLQKFFPEGLGEPVEIIPMPVPHILRGLDTVEVKPELNRKQRRAKK